MNCSGVTARKQACSRIELAKSTIGQLIEVAFGNECHLTIRLEIRPRRQSYSTKDAAEGTIIESRYSYAAQSTLRAEELRMLEVGQRIGLVGACTRIEYVPKDKIDIAGTTPRASMSNICPTHILPNRHLLLSDPTQGGVFWVYPWKITELHVISP